MVLFLYNLFLLASLKTKSYVWYCVYLFCLLLFLLETSGIGHEFIWKDFDFGPLELFGVFYPLMFTAALQFSRTFLKSKERFPRIDILLKTFIVVFFIVIVGGILSNKVVILKLFSLASFMLIALPFIGLYAWRKGYKEARFYTFAWSAWVIGMAPAMLVVVGMNIKYEDMLMSTRFGLLLEATLLSFALADQINILRRERDAAIQQYEEQKDVLEFQSRLAQMGEMIAAIGHQWKQPLSIISMASDFLQDRLERKDKIEFAEEIGDLKSVRKVVLHMSKTLDDFKNFFAPDKKRHCFEIKKSIDEVLSMVGKQYEYANIVFEFSGSLDASICGQENEFKQVIINIFNNARDAFLERNVENRKISVDISELSETGSVVLTISDNAGGVPDEVEKKLFDQYFTTKGSKGTGIGLHICRLVIEKSFLGTIEARNAMGGLRFTITMPKGEEKA